MRSAHLVLVATIGCGCSQGATLTMRDGTTYSGRAVAKDEAHILIETPEGRYVICKRDVTDASYAGYGLAAAGFAVIASSLAVPGAGAPMLFVGIGLLSIGESQQDANADVWGLPASDEALAIPCSGQRYVGPRRTD